MRKVLFAVAMLSVALGACTGDDNGDAESDTSSSGSTVVEDELEPGPLQAHLKEEDAIGVSGPVDKNCRGSRGGGLENATGEQVRILGVEAVVSEGITILGIMTQPKGPGVGNNPGFPPKEVRNDPDVHDLVGTVLEPGEIASYFIGGRLDSESEGYVKQFAFTYEVDGVRYRAVDNDEWRLSEYPEKGRCPR